IWRRPFDWMRSFNTPVMQLERQTGKQAGDRRRTLGLRFGSYALALQMLGFLFEFAMMIGLSMLLLLFLAPMGVDNLETEDMWTWLDTAITVVSFCVIGPFYVGGGFSLYLNRRIILEAWDVELNLKRLRARVDAISAKALGVLLVAILVVVPDGVYAAKESKVEAERETQVERTPPPLQTPMREVAVEVVKHEDFGSEKVEQEFRFRWEADKKKSESSDFDFFGGVGEFIASVLQVLGWMLLAVILGTLVYLIWRTFGGYTPDTAIGKQAPKVLFGLNIAPETLPDDISAAALALIAQGQVRDALSLIYRGALSYLVHARNLRVSAGATESEVATLSKRVLTPGGVAYFGGVLSQWIDIAYAGRLPDVQAITALANGYAEHFPSLTERKP
ncbi:MAG: hypothetical protein IPK97_13145, partial [Ahniella sp.]|nr:hypothetical protein [Ahniella sp.]